MKRVRLYKDEPELPSLFQVYEEVIRGPWVVHHYSEGRVEKTGMRNGIICRVIFGRFCSYQAEGEAREIRQVLYDIYYPTGEEGETIYDEGRLIRRGDPIPSAWIEFAKLHDIPM